MTLARRYAASAGSSALTVPLRRCARKSGTSTEFQESLKPTTSGAEESFMERRGFIVLRVDATGTILEYHASPGMAPGRPVDVIGRNVGELGSGEAAASIQQAITQALSGDCVVEVSYSIAFSGETRDRQARFTPTGRGDVLGMICDDTAERLVEARRVHLAEILEASTDYVATTDLFGRILYANGAFRARFGIPTVDGFSEQSYSLFDFFTDQSRERFLADGVATLWREGRWSGEIEGVDDSGATIPLWQAAIAHLGPSGKPEFFSGIARDITEMKHAQAEVRRSGERFSALLAFSSDVILILTAEGVISYASPAIERILGYRVDELIGTFGFDLIHPDDVATAAEAFAAAFTGANSPDGLQYRVKHRNGTWRWTESYTTNHLDAPDIGGFVVNARDITARHEANDRLERASQLLASVMGAAASEAIFVTDGAAEIVAFSHGAEVLLGYRADEVVGVLHPRHFHTELDIAEVADGLGISADELFLHAPLDGRSIEREWMFVRKDGSSFDGQLTVSPRFDSTGVLCGFLYVARDVTDRRRAQAELTQLARHDALTGLANRPNLQSMLAAASLADSWADPGRTLMFIDLDHFKAVNDTLGHAAGDAVLVGVAERLKHNLREQDLPVRLGGDEFVVLLGAGADAEVGRVVAERLVKSLQEPFEFEGSTVQIGASIGLATSRRGMTPDELLATADGAAYIAKRSGRGRAATA